MIIICALFAAIGAYMARLGIMQIRLNGMYRQCSAVIRAQVKDYIEKNIVTANGVPNRVLVPVYQFDLNDRIYNAVEISDLPIRHFQIGDVVELRIDPNDPTKALGVRYSIKKVLLPGSLILLFAVVGFVLGLLSTFGG